MIKLQAELHDVVRTKREGGGYRVMLNVPETCEKEIIDLFAQLGKEKMFAVGLEEIQ